MLWKKTRKMSIILPSGLPAISMLRDEGIILDMATPTSSSIVPLRIAVLNLMPIKETTERDFVRVLSASELPIQVDFMKIRSHTSRHCSPEHMERFYRDSDIMMRDTYDGLIVTGAPLEQIPFEEVTYWDELCSIFDWARRSVRSTLYICWAAQAGLYHFYDIDKHAVPAKVFGIFPHRPTRRLEGEKEDLPIFRGFDDEFFAPHSRHTTILRDDILRAAVAEHERAVAEGRESDALRIISESVEAGVHMVMARSGREFFITGHSEYSPLTLDSEYRRDVAKGLPINIPCHYYPDDDPQREPLVRWRSHAHLLFGNWLKYYVKG